MDGYGTIVSVEHRRAQFYETTAISCVPGISPAQVGSVGGDGTVRFAADGVTYTLKANRPRTRLVLHQDISVGDRNLRRLRGLPAECTRPGPLATFDIFWKTYAENYPFFAAKGVDWPAVRDKYRPRVRPDISDKRLFDLLVEMIKPLGDAHTGIENENRRWVGIRPGTTPPSIELEQKLRPFIERRDLHAPLPDLANGRIGYADLPGRIGYLRIIAFQGYTDPETFATDSAKLDEVLDGILTKQRTSGPDALRGLVIDLRINGGGSDALGLQVASRLTRQPYLAYTKRVCNDPGNANRFTEPQPLWVRPANKPIYTGPIAILTGGSTISAGETFIQATMDRQPRPVRIGENTQGVFSDVLVRSLPNGWKFVLPNEEFLTRDGRTFDGTGIPPQLRTPVFTDEEFANDRDSAFDRAVALLSQS